MSTRMCRTNSVPTGRLELPRPLGRQILSLTRLPIPPRRQSGAKHRLRNREFALSGADANRSATTPSFLLKSKLDVPPILSRLSSVSQAVRPEADPGLPGVAWPRRLCCDETEPRRARPTRLAPGCTLAQPATLLPPLVGSYPTVSALTGPPLPVACAGIAFCCGCSRCGLAACSALTCCFVRQPSCALPDARGSREVPLAARGADGQRQRSSLPYPFVKVLHC